MTATPTFTVGDPWPEDQAKPIQWPEPPRQRSFPWHEPQSVVPFPVTRAEFEALDKRHEWLLTHMVKACRDIQKLKAQVKKLKAGKTKKLGRRGKRR